MEKDSREWFWWKKNGSYSWTAGINKPHIRKHGKQVSDSFSAHVPLCGKLFFGILCLTCGKHEWSAETPVFSGGESHSRQQVIKQHKVASFPVAVIGRCSAQPLKRMVGEWKCEWCNPGGVHESVCFLVHIVCLYKCDTICCCNKGWSHAGIGLQMEKFSRCTMHGFFPLNGIWTVKKYADNQQQPVKIFRP